MVLLGGGTFLFGLLPLKLSKVFYSDNGAPKHDEILSILLCAGGGMLLVLSLVHLLPEVKKCYFIICFHHYFKLI